jgi:hypothetical protein
VAPRPPRWILEPPLGRAAGSVAAAALVLVALVYYSSRQYTDVGYRPVQPIPYSHALHAGELGIDCLYCHATVERAPAAVVPPTRVCMNCHHVVKRDSPVLAALRESASTGRPIEWIRVHDLPGFAYFDHRPHLRAGVGCSTCHGRIDEMEVVQQAKPLDMVWCLDCHRDPEPYLRPADQLTAMDWTAPGNQRELAARIVAERRLAPPVDDCTGCHR